ncbi:protein kinase [Streptomyces sp. SID5474]|nr:protein kinase [Streptomyces sp. SID5474]
MAVKVVRAELLEDGGAEFRRRFAREVKSARAVDAAFTARMVDADPDAEIPWLAMEFVAGIAFGDALTRFGPLPEASLSDLASGLFTALNGIHAAGLVHRDVKPSNVMLAADGPVVIDFGIARSAGMTGLTRTAQTVGTLGFMSPEQFERSDVGPESDVFSAGVVLAYAATGRPPFAGDTLPVLFANLTMREPDLDGLPTGLVPVVRAALAKDPAHRPTAGQARALLPAPPTRVGADPGWLPPALTRAVLQVATTALAAVDPAPPPQEISTTAQSVLASPVDGKVASEPADAPTRTDPLPPRRPDGVPRDGDHGGARIDRRPDRVLDPGEEPAGKPPTADAAGAGRGRAVRLSIIGSVVGLAVLGGTIAWKMSSSPQDRAGGPSVSQGSTGAGRASTPRQTAPTPPPGLIAVLAVQSAGPQGMPNAVTSVAFSPDGYTLATGGTDGTIRLWSTRSHQQKGPPLEGNGGTIATMRFSSDGLLASFGGDNTVRLWRDNKQIGEPLDSKFRVGVPSLVFSPDGRFLFTSAEKGSTRQWLVSTHQQMGPDIPTYDVRDLAFSDKSTFATAGSRKGDPVRLWDLTTKAPIGEFPADGGIYAVAFSPDGHILATGNSPTGTTRLWDVQNRRQIGELPDGNISTVAFSPDKRTVATASDSTLGGRVRLWDLATLQQVGEFPRDDVRAMAFSPDGRSLATASDTDGTVTLWEVPARP